MFLIGEMSKISQVSMRMLRYYDKNNVFKPKIVDEWTGYRYYTAEQLDDLYKIIQLRDLGFSVNEIAELIPLQDKEEYVKRLKDRQAEIMAEIEQSQHMLGRLNAYISDVLDEKKQEISIVMKSISDKDVISLRRTVKDYYCEGQLWAEMSEKLIPLGFGMESEAFSLYHDTDYREENVDIEICVTCGSIKCIPDGLIHRQVPGAEHAVSLIIKGAYSRISEAYRQFAFWLEGHPEYEMAGPNRQICHVGVCDTDHEEEYVTELLIPLRCKK